jgi:hypothetical protein
LAREFEKEFVVKRAVTILSLLLWTLSYGTVSFSVKAQGVSPQAPTITLYSKNKYKEDPRAACFNFDARTLIPNGGRCDIHYGTLYAGDDFDWFQSGATAINRSLIKDLGRYSWTDAFTVPVIEPLPKLKPGEQRHVTIDTSGADGADGLPGKPAVNGDGIVRPTAEPTVVAPSKPKNDGKPKIDPIFVKAIVGHMYLIHVVDQSSDFYALFLVESLERGDKCTISWRKIPAPQLQAVKTVE